jgi:hypothetical protein
MQDLTYSTCTVDGCDKASRTRTASWCQMHYCRHWRTGSVDLIRRPARDGERRTNGLNGYVKICVPDHPLAHCGWLFEHRAVAFEARGGAEPTECEWCREPLNGWAEACVDHLDFDRGNNTPGNLIVACRSCNASRTPQADPARWAAMTAARAILRQYADEVAAERARINDVLGCDGVEVRLIRGRSRSSTRLHRPCDRATDSQAR